MLHIYRMYNRYIPIILKFHTVTCRHCLVLLKIQCLQKKSESSEPVQTPEISQDRYYEKDIKSRTELFTSIKLNLELKLRSV